MYHYEDIQSCVHTCVWIDLGVRVDSRRVSVQCRWGWREWKREKWHYDAQTGQGDCTPESGKKRKKNSHVLTKTNLLTTTKSTLAVVPLCYYMYLYICIHTYIIIPFWTAWQGWEDVRLPSPLTMSERLRTGGDRRQRSSDAGRGTAYVDGSTAHS